MGGVLHIYIKKKNSPQVAPRTLGALSSITPVRLRTGMGTVGLANRYDVLPFYARVVISAKVELHLSQMSIIRATKVIYELYSIVTSVISTAVEPG